ncbi:MAG: AAA family ATPase [Harvfovirus sp.]|uniref:AAA family ATPase n=1 Tax=Harvfovirus sp. TaxID=2487768 RepID=A0A3G5A1J9_9VIRU|nr:MAG: AAA family ATPase [Harvfovirus sp.]
MSCPPEFTYTVKFPFNSAFLYDLETYAPVDRIFDAAHNGQTFYAQPAVGPLTILDVKCYVSRCDDTHVIINFPSSKEWKLIHKTIADLKHASKAKIKYQIYRYTAQDNYWYLDATYKFKGTDELIGYDTYIENIEKDIRNFTLHSDFLNKIGESKSLNYLLYGPPGTGKTTLIRTLASKHNFTICIINPNGLDYKNLVTALNPVIDVPGPKILLFEDFDRFLQDGSKDIVMSQILNSLDGLDDSSNILRFFTGNDCDVIFGNKALINRMSAKFKFSYPEIPMFKAKLMRFLTYRKNPIDDEKVNAFLYKVSKKKITMRPFVNYCIRYLFEDNYLDQMISHHEELDD